MLIKIFRKRKISEINIFEIDLPNCSNKIYVITTKPEKFLEILANDINEIRPVFLITKKNIETINTGTRTKYRRILNRKIHDKEINKRRDNKMRTLNSE